MYLVSTVLARLWLCVTITKPFLRSIKYMVNGVLCGKYKQWKEPNQCDSFKSICNLSFGVRHSGTARQITGASAPLVTVTNFHMTSTEQSIHLSMCYATVAMLKPRSITTLIRDFGWRPISHGLDKAWIMLCEKSIWGLSLSHGRTERWGWNRANCDTSTTVVTWHFPYSYTGHAHIATFISHILKYIIINKVALML